MVQVSFPTALGLLLLSPSPNPVARDAGGGGEPAAAKSTAPAAAPAEATSPAPMVEELEIVEEIVEFEEEGEAAGGVAALVGYVHPAAVHLPIAWVLLLVLVDLVTFLVGRVVYQRVGRLLLLFTLLSFIPALVSGLVRFSILDPQGTASEDALFHRNLMFAAAAMLIVAALLRLPGKVELSGARRHAYLGFVITAAGLVAYGGHVGGVMVYGDIPW